MFMCLVVSASVKIFCQQQQAFVTSCWQFFNKIELTLGQFSFQN